MIIYMVSFWWILILKTKIEISVSERQKLTVKTSAQSRFEAVSYSVLCVTTKTGEIPYMVITYSSDEHRCPAVQIFCLWATGIQKCGQHGGVVVSTVSSQALGLSPDWGFSVYRFYILFRYSGFLPQSWGEVTTAAEIGSGILNWRSSIRWIEEIKRKSV